MWAEAAKLEKRRSPEQGPILGLQELTGHEYDQCLQAVHIYYRSNRGLQRAVEKGRGPGSSADRGQPCADYNGRDGGCNVKWYLPAVFLREVERRGAGLSTVTERVCMEALQATSNASKDCPLARGDDAKAFAGPQCFPQLQDEARLHANMPAPAAGADTAVPPPSAARD